MSSASGTHPFERIPPVLTWLFRVTAVCGRMLLGKRFCALALTTQTILMVARVRHERISSDVGGLVGSGTRERASGSFGRIHSRRSVFFGRIRIAPRREAVTNCAVCEARAILVRPRCLVYLDRPFAQGCAFSARQDDECCILEDPSTFRYPRLLNAASNPGIPAFRDGHC